MKTACEQATPLVNPIPPAITDARKTFGALAVFALACANTALDVDILNDQVVSRIGPGWTFMAAMQWLGGVKAAAVVQGLTDRGTFGGMSKQAMLALMQHAQSVSAQWPPHATDAWLLSQIRSSLTLPH